MKRALIVSAFIAATATTGFAGAEKEYPLKRSFWQKFERAVQRLDQVGHVTHLRNDADIARTNPTCENLEEFRHHFQATREVMADTWRQLRTLNKHVQKHCQ